jgi:hypothetical protein
MRGRHLIFSMSTENYLLLASRRQRDGSPVVTWAIIPDVQLPSDALAL